VALSLIVNGREVELNPGLADTPLLWVLRDTLGLMGVKYGCGVGVCGACSVLMGDKRIFSCIATVRWCVGQPITTIEGLEADPLGKHLQDVWVETDVVQCGYCQPGQLIAATALLKANPKPNDAAIDAGMKGNLCRCGTYPRIREAVKIAAKGSGA
jgi:isoquinoline 1-oxidoreductase alpha subunit